MWRKNVNCIGHAVFLKFWSWVEFLNSLSNEPIELAFAKKILHSLQIKISAYVNCVYFTVGDLEIQAWIYGLEL